MAESAINIPTVLAELEACVARYESALMSNDIDTLDELFWASPHTRRYGAAENLYGFDEISAYRRARPGGAPARRILRQSITSFGRDFASADLEFQPLGSDRIGRQTQCWARLQQGWRIVSAHVSFMTTATG